MADISKIKLANGTVVTLKDAKARADLLTLLGSHALTALESAAWLAADSEVKSDATGVATTAAVKNYVDAQVGAVSSFDVVVLAASTELPTAAKETMYKIYLKPDEDVASGSYVEYITIRSGAEGSYTYAWEQIGTTTTDLTGYVQKTTKIAGIDLQDDITAEELSGADALNLQALSHKNSATGTGKVFTIDSITMAESTVAGNATVAHTETEASITAKASFTPAGKIQVAGADQSMGGDVLTGGDINVTLKDAVNKSEANITAGAYKPAGEVAASLVAAGDGETEGVFSIKPSISKPSVSVSGDDKNVLTSTVITAGVLPNLAAHTGFNGGSLEKGTAIAAATEGLTAHVAAGNEIAGDVDAETLVFSAAQTAEAMPHAAEFTPAVYGQDNFTQGSFPVYEAATVKAVTGASLDAAPEADAVKVKVSASFDGTEEANMKVSKVEYFKQEVDTKSFTPTKATLGFVGTEAENLIPTTVKYDKANANAAFSVKVTPEVAAGGITRTEKDVEVTVE